MYVKQLAKVKKESLDQANTKLIVIGCGGPGVIDTYAGKASNISQPFLTYSHTLFEEQTGFSGPIYANQTRELFFEFGHVETRDDCAVTLLQSLETVKFLQESGVLSEDEKESAEAAKEEHQSLQEARQGAHNEHDLKLPNTAESARTLLPFA